MSQRITQRIIPQPALSRALQRRLSMPAVDHGFDVVSDPPPADQVAEGPEKPAEPPQRVE